MALGRKKSRHTVSNPGRVSLSANALKSGKRTDGQSETLTASGARIKRGEANTMRRLVQPWQTRAFAYYDLLGEIKYASQFYSRSLSGIELLAAELNDDGEWVPTEDADAIAVLDRVRDPGGGRSALLASYGRLMFLVGEGLLFVTKDKDTQLEQWEFLSTDELRLQDGTYTRFKAPSLQAENFREPDDDNWDEVEDDTAVAYRFWRRHPRYSMLADSTMQGVLDLCEELVLLTQAVRARARSRLAGSGILFISDAFAFTPLETESDEDIDMDPFTAELIEAMTSPIVDEGSASAVVPLVVRGSTEAIDKGVKHIQIIDPTQIYPETGLRYEVIKRIAIGLDMPVEILLGMQDSNHWTSWQIDEQTWKAHLQPVAQQLVDDLGSAYMRPTLKADGKEDWQRFGVIYDATKIVNHPDRSKDAKDLWSLGAISLESLRTAAGFDEDDAPTEMDRAERIGIAVRDGSLAWFGVPSKLGTGGIEPVAGDIETADTLNQNGGGKGTDPKVDGASTTKGPPEKKTDEEHEPVTGSLRYEATVARILGASDICVLRARELAGNRLRGIAKRDTDALAALEGVRTGLVAATLGIERTRALRAPSPAELIAGSRDLILDALRVWDINGDVAARIAEVIEAHAARTLYQERPAPLPPAFSNYVAGLLITDGRDG